MKKLEKATKNDVVISVPQKGFLLVRRHRLHV